MHISIYYPTIYIQSKFLFLCYVMSHSSIDQEIFSTIDWHFTKAWSPTSLLKTHRRLSACLTLMRVQFLHERRRNATMVKIRHGLATLNTNNSFVCGQKHKVWILVFLVRMSRKNLRIQLRRFNKEIATKPHRLLQLHSRNAAKYFIKWVG